MRSHAMGVTRSVSILKAGMLGVALLLASQAGFAQDAAAKDEKPAESKPAAVEEPRLFHLVFVLKEVEEGKVINSRTYTTSIATSSNDPRDMNRYGFAQSQNGSIRTGAKVPVQTEAGKVEYMDVGVNIDSRHAEMLRGQLAMDVTAEISSLESGKNASPAPPASPEHAAPPLIRQTRWTSAVMVAIGKPTVIFTSDDVTSKRTMQLELTATEIH